MIFQEIWVQLICIFKINYFPCPPVQGLSRTGWFGRGRSPQRNWRPTTDPDRTHCFPRRLQLGDVLRYPTRSPFLYQQVCALLARYGLFTNWCVALNNGPSPRSCAPPPAINICPLVLLVRLSRRLSSFNEFPSAPYHGFPRGGDRGYSFLADREFMKHIQWDFGPSASIFIDIFINTTEAQTHRHHLLSRNDGCLTSRRSPL